MPLTGQAKKEYMRRYEEARREERRKQKRANRLAKLDQYLAVQEKRNRKAGHAPRAKGPKAAKRVRVPKVRRYVFIEDRVYFNRETGFTLDEMKRIVKEFTQCD